MPVSLPPTVTLASIPASTMTLLPVSLPVLPTSVPAALMTIQSSTFMSQEQSAEVIMIRKHY